MTLGERPPLGVLTGEPDRDALGEQRRKRERLGVRPDDAAVIAERLGAGLELPDELRDGR